ALGTDLIFLAFVAMVAGLLTLTARQVSRPYTQGITIHLSFTALPVYTLLSLGRGFAAYVLSLIFTLIYGTIAAHNHKAERVMIPALDVLQAIPVLAFLPGLVLAMVHLFPTRELGLELACVVMIFTAQVWNMTFSFHGSLRAIPAPLREVATIQHLSNWQIFKLLELPAAMIGLVWNSMMSMAGGWFFLTVNEAFTLAGHDYRLPGIGSYMNEAINVGNIPAMIAAIIAMVIMIVAVDQLFWRPIVVWSQRFKLEDSTGGDAAQSWMLNLLQKSRLYQRVQRMFQREDKPVVNLAAAPSHETAGTGWAWALIGVRWLVLAGLAVGSIVGAAALVHLLIELHMRQWLTVLAALLASFGRTTAAVALGAAWTLPVGILIGLSPKWSERLQPFIQIIASFPAPMLFPLVTMLLIVLHVPFTIGCVALMLLGAQWYILFNVIAGATAIPADLKEVAGVYRASRWQRWTRLYIPSVFPYLVTGLVTAAGGAWNATIVSEYVLLRGKTFEAFGLGSAISKATNDGDYPMLCASVVVMAAAVVLINRFFWKKMYRLAEERYSLL
ncbi:MAG: ABC transporter permease subunit, partial [Phycisphaerae bacterium]|nr:ABC transporter permease subunit [Phycisphaerae bacterium]